MHVSHRYLRNRKTDKRWDEMMGIVKNGVVEKECGKDARKGEEITYVIYTYKVEQDVKRWWKTFRGSNEHK